MAEVQHPALDDPSLWVPYRYQPSKAAAIVFITAFSLTTLLHLSQVFRRKTWYFIPLVVGGVFEIVGFVGRLLSTNDVWALGPYIMQSLLLLIAPALFAASIYIILGRIILLTGAEDCSLIRQRWLTKIFVAGDVISFITQCGGGGIQAAGSLSLLHTGEKIIVVGLFLQLTFFGIFIVVAGIFHYRLSKSITQSSSNSSRLSKRAKRQHSSRPRHSSRHHDASDINVQDLPWKRHMTVLYFASALIMVRSVIRVIEYLQGNNGYFLRHEIFLYMFDALLMFIVMVLFNCIHPAEVTDLYQKRLLRQSSSLSNEMTERYLRDSDDHMERGHSRRRGV